MLRVLLIGALLLNCAYAQTVTGLKGSYKKGQVFLTWTNVSNAASLYKVYRSTTQITSSSQIAACEYLGYVNNKSSKDFNLSNNDSTNRYLRIDSAGTPLSSSTGLFVATTLFNGNYFYAVTTFTSGTENSTITSGINSLSTSISETVSLPQPVFQELRIINEVPIEIWATFQSAKYSATEPLLLNWGFFSHDIALNRSTLDYTNPMQITNHGGGSNFLESIASNNSGEVKMNLEDWFPDSTISSGYWGSNAAYDIFNSDNNSPPTTGTNVNYSQLLLNRTIDWAIHHVAFDTNRISIYATSTGSPGAFLYAITYPERIAAVELHVGAFNFGFLNDYNPNCSLNSGKKNRKEGDKRLGKVETNLDCNLGYKTYDALNGGWVIHNFPDREYPFIYSINGKQDKQVGWTEKTIWYDSLNNNHFGGWYFWDNRDHNGDNGKTWGINNFDVFRYKRNQSYPAINNCSLNEDFGNGDGNTGADYGTVNAAVDWSDNIIDNDSSWSVKLFVRDLIKKDLTLQIYPDSCTADVTPRRRQEFKPIAGSTINYVVTHLGNQIQNGSVLYQDGPLVIPAVKIFKDTSIITLTASNLLTFFQDFDNDGYGNINVSIQAAIQPNGYVTSSNDCNDNNALINPGAADICNSMDDNCNGVTDENAVTVSISATGATTVCQPNVVSFTSTITGSIDTYQWNNNAIAISGATNNNYAATSTGSYSLKVSNSFCSSTSSTIAATINPIPDVNVTPSGTITECKGNKITFSAISVLGNTYQWLKGGAVISGATNATYQTGQNETGNFSVTITNANACNATSAVTTLNRLDAPTATITPLGNLDICITGNVTLQANSGTGYTYKWKKDGKNISGATNQTYVATSTGSYKVKVTSSNGCSKTSSATNVTKSCKIINEATNLLGNEISIHPVPNNGKFEINFTNFSLGNEGTIWVSDVLGRKVITLPIEIASNAYSKAVTLDNDLPDGIYFVEFITQGKKYVKMITVIKNLQ